MVRAFIAENTARAAGGSLAEVMPGPHGTPSLALQKDVEAAPIAPAIGVFITAGKKRFNGALGIRAQAAVATYQVIRADGIAATRPRQDTVVAFPFRPLGLHGSSGIRVGPRMADKGPTQSGVLEARGGLPLSAPRLVTPLGVLGPTSGVDLTRLRPDAFLSLMPS